MLKSKRIQLTKKDISKKIKSKIGLSVSYTDKICDSLIVILKDLIKTKETNIKNFGSFKIINKKERIGRNPKTGEEVPITARSVVTFRASNVLKSKVNSKNKININISE